MQKFVPKNFVIRSQFLYSSNSKLLLTSVNLGFSALLKNMLISPRPNEASIYYLSINEEMCLYFLVSGSIQLDLRCHKRCVVSASCSELGKAHLCFSDAYAQIK